MAKYVVSRSSIQDIADSIREKNGSEKTYKPAEMGPAIRNLPIGTPFWFGTRNEYNSLQELDPTMCYCIEEGT